MLGDGEDDGGGADDGGTATVEKARRGRCGKKASSSAQGETTRVQIGQKPRKIFGGRKPESEGRHWSKSRTPGAEADGS